MTLKLFTFRGHFTGKIYYGTGHTVSQASHEIGIKQNHLILEKTEVIPNELRLETLGTPISEPSPN